MAQLEKQNESKPTELGDLLPAKPSSRFSRRTVIIWLVAVSLIFFFLPLYLVANAIRSDIASMESDLKSIKGSMASGPTPPPDVQKMISALSKTQDQANRLNAIYPTLMAPRADWLSVMSGLAAYDQNQIAIISLNYSNQQITLAGRAASDDAVMSYAAALEQSDLFSRVLIQSIQAMPTPTFEVSAPARTPTAKPSSTKQPVATTTSTPMPQNLVVSTSTPTTAATSVPTSTPTTAATSTPTQTFTPSSTPDLRDSFEPDDAQPKPIALGQSQQHNFFPAGDIDAVTFLAKSGRFYRVTTMELAPGVDTVLNVRAGSIALTNDDIAPGTQASEITFENTSDDVMAVVTITNRGQFGSDKTYKILVVEMVPTPTSVPNAPTRTGWMNGSILTGASAMLIAGAVIDRGWRATNLSRPQGPPRENANVSSSLDRMPVKFVIVLDLKVAAP